MDDPAKTLGREELLDLYKHYGNSIQAELDFFYKSFNFYIGLLSAILAGTLTGLLNIKSGQLPGLALLIGPILILFLSRIGYSNSQAFYRRFVEAWVIKINIESMLNLHQMNSIEPGIQQPLHKSDKGGFIPEIMWPRLKKVFDRAERESWSAEKLTQALIDKGVTLSHAKWTYILFSAAALAFLVAIVSIIQPWETL